MKNLHELDQYRVKDRRFPALGYGGAFKVFVNGRSFFVIASTEAHEDGVWEHISISPKNQKRCPTWEEMCAIKDMFFEPEEECIEFHPKKSSYVNINSYCLHIWRKADGSISEPSFGRMSTLKERDEELEKLWLALEDVPMNPETECIESEFLCFPAGTNREEIWHWFDERHTKGVHYLLYGRRLK